MIATDARGIRHTLPVIVGRPHQQDVLFLERAIFDLAFRRHIDHVDLSIKEVKYRRYRWVVLYLALADEDEDAVDIIEDVLGLAILAYQVVTPGRGVEYLEVAARIGIATACIVGVILDLASENGLAGAALDNVEDEQELEVDVEVVIDLEVFYIELQELLLVERG